MRHIILLLVVSSLVYFSEYIYGKDIAIGENPVTVSADLDGDELEEKVIISQKFIKTKDGENSILRIKIFKNIKLAYQYEVKHYYPVQYIKVTKFSGFTTKDVIFFIMGEANSYLFCLFWESTMTEKDISNLIPGKGQYRFIETKIEVDSSY